MKLDRHDAVQLDLDVPVSPQRRQRKRAQKSYALRPKSKPIAKSKSNRKLLEKPSHWTLVRTVGSEPRNHLTSRVTSIHSDAAHWLAKLPDNSIHAVVTDPPYGVIEYNGLNQQKLRDGKGGVWRIPPSFDGAKRSPLPRFTVLTAEDRIALVEFFSALAKDLARVLVPGGHVVIASNPLLSSQAFVPFEQAGFEKRGEVIRLVQTLRGGDRPKGAEAEFDGVSVMARACWEPWGIFRKPFDGTVAANLRKWGTGGLRRISASEPFKDVIACSPTRGAEKRLAPHPSLKPQRFMRQVVRAVLPLGEGIVYDPFTGSGSTLAAAEALGYHAIGTERDSEYFKLGCRAFLELSKLKL